MIGVRVHDTTVVSDTEHQLVGVAIHDSAVVANAVDQRVAVRVANPRATHPVRGLPRPLIHHAVAVPHFVVIHGLMVPHDTDTLARLRSLSM